MYFCELNLFSRKWDFLACATIAAPGENDDAYQGHDEVREKRTWTLDPEPQFQVDDMAMPVWQGNFFSLT